jgi:hypothetical protein
MSERVTSFFLLLGGVLALAALWYLSFIFVRRDTARRGLGALERKAWVAAAAALPLFGFALYLFVYILGEYFSPNAEVVAPPPEAPGPLPVARSVEEGDGTIPAHPAAVFPAETSLPSGTEVYAAPDATPATIPALYRPVRGRCTLFLAMGPHAGLEHPLDNLPLWIGRGNEPEGPPAALNLESDMNVSRSHAEIYEWNGGLRIRDLGSTHGTQVNGVPVTDHPIVPGDRISIGGSTIILRDQT